MFLNYRKTKTVDKEVTVREDRLLCLLIADDVVLDTEEEHLCTLDVGLLAVSSCLCCLQREITCVICQHCIWHHQLSDKNTPVHLWWSLKISTAPVSPLHFNFSKMCQLIFILFYFISLSLYNSNTDLYCGYLFQKKRKGSLALKK